MAIFLMIIWLIFLFCIRVNFQKTNKQQQNAVRFHYPELL